jgi:hypothetical protein
MPSLTRRRDPDANQETWLIHYDIRVGSIAMRAGVTADKDQWDWSVGFYPAWDRGLRASGTAKSFDAARAAFDIAWQWLLPKITEADFTEYRRHRTFDAWTRAMWDAGCKLPTQVADGRSTCFCGAAIGIADMASPHLFRAHGARRLLKDSGLFKRRAVPSLTPSESSSLRVNRRFKVRV